MSDIHKNDNSNISEGNEISELPSGLQRSEVGIEVDDLIKIYKQGKIEVVALRGLTCKFHRGEISVIMGPSGCGKTTLLNLIGGLDRPNSGKIIYENKNICGLEDKEIENYRREKVGYVFQFMNLIPELTGIENVMLPMMFVNKSEKEQKERAEQLLKLVGLEKRAHHKPDELSGGEQQRVAIASALANNPDILLCDELTGELDSESKYNIFQVLKDVVKEYPDKVVICVTHDAELTQIADRLFYIRDGAISHEVGKEKLQMLEGGADESEDSGDYKARIKRLYAERMLREFRELEFNIKNKIEEIEKDLE